MAQLFPKISNHLRILTICDSDGNIETIRTTDEHPFYVEGIGWLAAKDLQRGDRLNEANDSNDARVIGSVREEHPEGIAVYNFEVQGDHTYFVEDGSGEQTALWVHNQCDVAQIYGQGVYVPITVRGQLVQGYGPAVPFNRQTHYGTTPTQADRLFFAGSPDHNPSLVVRYYEGDPMVGELPGFLQTPAQRALSAADRSRMRTATQNWHSQGGTLRLYSLRMRRLYGL